MEDSPSSSADPLPRESLSEAAARVDRALAQYGYELDAAIAAIDDATAGYGGLFDPDTDAAELRAACETVIAAGPPEATAKDDTVPPELVLYVDGSSRGNPGPAGAGAVVQTADQTLAKLGRPVGRHADNNIAEYAALQLGLTAVSEYEPASLEVRIDSMTVIDDVWRGGSDESFLPYSDAVAELLSAIPAHRWTHLADSDPNPADSRATVGADIAAIGPG
ncbi:ribonuclease HI family protein [Halovenus halobia]|uniref:ribonuclease HI family protein n=1 Tax=Halovenus halobia TaxID=3396622 RepID=UPI003F58004C